MGVEHQRFDRGSKWIVAKHGDLLLKVAGITDIPKWRALASDIVQPRQLPDGLIEVERESGTALYLIEIATYPDRRVAEQVFDDLSLVYQNRRVLPEAIVFVLRPKGNARVAQDFVVTSGSTELSGRWKVIELWTLSAEELLKTGEPALMPLVPLAKFTGNPELLLRQCRRVIDEKAGKGEVASLLAVCQVFAGLAIRDAKLIHRILGTLPMTMDLMDSVIAQEIMAFGNAKRMHRAILKVLQSRFEQIPEDLRTRLELVTDDLKLDTLVVLAGACNDLEEFRLQLAAC